MRPSMKKMETRRLHSPDMKELVRVLQGVPFPASQSKEKMHRKLTKEDIHDLPRRLRSSSFSISSTALCSTHKGLDAHLMNDICAWLRHEIDGAIGKFLYPLIMSAALTRKQELKVRQLEPVRQMWLHDFNMETSAPPGCEPVQRGAKWAFQEDQCPACMLARIGSDEDVLFALFAGMVGRLKTKVSGADIRRGRVDFEKLRSKRLRFVRYWIKECSRGDRLLVEAGELGVKMKLLRHEWKTEQRRLRHTKDVLYAARRSLEGMTVSNIPIHNAFRANDENERPLSPAGTGRHRRRSSFRRISRISFDAAAAQTTLCRSPSSGSDSTVRPEDSVSSVGLRPAPLRPWNRVPPLSQTPPQQKSQTEPPTRTPRASVSGDTHTLSAEDEHSGPRSPRSTATFQTITSYDGAGAPAHKPCRAHPYDPLDNPLYELQTQAQLVEKYRGMLAAHPDAYADEQDDMCALPSPRPQSMYSAFANGAFDENAFEAADEEVGWEEDEGDAGEHSEPQTPRPGAGVGGWRIPAASTAWSSLY